MAMGFTEFKQKVLTDKTFAERVRSMKSMDEAVEFGRTNGYTFTVDDIKAHGKLSDSELDAVAGGAHVMAKAYFMTK